MPVRRIFDMENPFWQGLSVIADMMILNLLTLLCCAPLVTIGAALAAMNDVVIHIVRQEDSGILKSFGRAFRQNLKNGMLFSMILLIAMGLLYFDYICALTYAEMFRYGIAALAILLLAITIYTLALLARYENRLGTTLKNAAVLAVGYFPQTLGMVCFTTAFWLLCIHFWRYGTPVLILFGFSLPCYVNIMLMRKMFQQLEKEKEDEGEA